jgi:hypothetical protein
MPAAAEMRPEVMMVEIGYHLVSEAHGPKDLIRYAQRAEQAGF